MIIVANKSGQLANRLFLFGHLIAFVLEHGGTVLNPTFAEYADYFPATRRDLLGRFPLAKVPLPASPSARSKLFELVDALRLRLRYRRRLSRVLSVPDVSADEVCHLDRETFQRLTREKKLLLLVGWNYRNYAAFDKHAETIRRTFQPAPEIQAHVAALLAECRKEGGVLVGVHLRRGDYKEHRGGRFYYEPSQYAEVMRKAAAVFAGQKVQFLLCSNEPIELSCFAGLSVHLGTGHIAEDLYAFAGCDYLLGPPSTYTMWASFMGQVPLYQVFDAEADVSLSDFRYTGGNCDVPEDRERWVEWREPMQEKQNIFEKQAL